jgi:hypothetical protein
MPVNSDKPSVWKEDVATSVDFYNDWFMKFAPKAYRDQRVAAAKQVHEALARSANLTNIRPEVLRENPVMLEMLRMTTAPPIARDRLIGLAGVAPNLVKGMELKKRIPPLMKRASVEVGLKRISELIMKMADMDIFPWLETGKTPNVEETLRASTIVADRLCGAQSDPIIRNAQEKRQLVSIKRWLEQRRYSFVEYAGKFDAMKPGTFAFHLNVSVNLETGKKVNIPVDVVIMPKQARVGELPLLIEAKSAGDFTNPNKRRKEEATKISQLRRTYGKKIRYILFLCGYFNSGYLGYEAAEGIDWVWEHRINDLAEFGV